MFNTNAFSALKPHPRLELFSAIVPVWLCDRALVWKLSKSRHFVDAMKYWWRQDMWLLASEIGMYARIRVIGIPNPLVGPLAWL